MTAHQAKPILKHSFKDSVLRITYSILNIPLILYFHINAISPKNNPYTFNIDSLY